MNNSLPPNSNEPQVLLNEVLLEFLKEQKRKRRWRIIGRGILLLLLIYCIYAIFDYGDEDKNFTNAPHVGLVDINGPIFDKDGTSADHFAKSLEAAFKSLNLKALIIRINSPGGSPVQADYMFNTIQYYRKTYPKIKIYAVCVDMCASAAYYVAAGAEEIYANPASLIGSIGVIYNGFGMVDTLQKLGMTRRLHTAGSNKGFLDPFTPESPEQVKYLESMLDTIHQQFINRVKEGRKNRLKPDGEIFSGLFWTGDVALQKGLIDGLASSGQLARDIIKLNKIVDYTDKPSVLERFSRNIGAAIVGQLPHALGLENPVRM